jgi:hypothetical protein
MIKRRSVMDDQDCDRTFRRTKRLLELVERNRRAHIDHRPRSGVNARNFTISGSPAFKVPMMNLVLEASYLANDEFQLVQLPYKGDEVSMVVIVPRKTARPIGTDGLGIHKVWRLIVHSSNGLSEPVTAFLPRRGPL